MINENGIEIKIKFEINLNKSIKFPEDVTIEEIEKYLLSLFNIDDKNIDVLQSNKKKLSKYDKKTKLSNTKFNEFVFDLGKVFNNLLSDDYTLEQETPKVPHLFIPSFSLNLDLDDENNFLGEGSFGNVFKCIYKNKNLAVKFKNSQFLDSISDREIPNTIFEREIMTYKELKHLNLPSFRGITYFSYKGKGILLDYVDGISLDKIQKDLSDNTKFDLLYQLADTLSYLHENGIIHRDIKPNNLLVENKTNILKLIDFGTSKLENDFNDNKMNTIKTIFNNSNSVYFFNDVCKNDFHIDIWSFGCVCYFLFTGKHPWNGNINSMNSDISNKVLYYEKDESLKKSTIIYDIIDLCCNLNNKTETNFKLLKNKFAVLKEIIAYSNDDNKENTFDILRHIYENNNKEQENPNPKNETNDSKEEFNQKYSYLNDKILFSEEIFYSKKAFLKIDLSNLETELENTLKEKGEDSFSAHLYYLIGLIYYLNKDPKSIEYFKKSISNYECLFHDLYSPNLAISLICLGKAYLQCNNTKESLNNFLDCLSIRERLYGKNHVSISEVYEKMIEVYIITKNSLELNKLIEESLNIRLSAEFNKPEDLANNYLKISSLYFLKKEYEKSLEQAKKSLEINLDIYKESNYVLAENKFQIAEIYSCLSKYDLARDKYIEVSKIYDKLLGENNMKTEKCYLQISKNHISDLEYEKATEGLLKCVTIRSSSIGESDYSNVSIYKLLGDCYFKSSKYENSIEYYSLALSITESILGNEHPETQALNNLINSIYEKNKNVT